MTDETATMTLIETGDDGVVYSIDLLLTAAQVRAIRGRRWYPTLWVGHPDDVWGVDSEGRPAVSYDCTDQPIPSDFEDEPSMARSVMQPDADRDRMNAEMNDRIREMYRELRND